MAGRFLLAALLFDAASISDALAKQQSAVKASLKPHDVEALARQNPELTDALKQPQLLFDSMSGRMSELQQGLLTARTESEATLTKNRELYGQKLKEQQERNEAAATLNKHLNERITNLKDENMHLRERADEFEERSRQVTVDLDELRENLTIARDYADRALNSSEESLHGASALSILAELDQEDTNASESREHADRLDEIGSAGIGLRKVAMIQLNAGGQKAKDPLPKELMQTLLASWDGISNEQNASEASLAESFEKEFGAGEAQYAVLLQTQTQLNATIVEQEALNQKLTTAVEYVTKTHNRLLEQRVSLKKFARRLSNRPLPKRQHEIVAEMKRSPKKP